jgi:hypothetical protein
MKFSDYLTEKGYTVVNEGILPTANTKKVKNALFKFVKSKIDKARQRDPEIMLGDKTSIIKLKEYIEQFALALGTYTTIDPKGTKGFVGQYTHGKDAWKAKKEIMNQGELGTSIIVINIMNELNLNTDGKNNIAKFEEELTNIAKKNI